MTMSEKLKKFLAIALLFVLVGVSYGAGFLHGHENLKFEKNFKPTITNRDLGKPKEVDFSLFWQVFDRLEDKFVGSIDREKAVYGAIAGLVGSTKDPYSVFLEPGPSKKFIEDIAGEFEGIGTEIAIRDNILTVISPLEGSPADLAGLKPKDRIIKIDGQVTNVLTLSEAVERIRGQSGTELTLTIFREGKDQPFEIKIKRAKIKVDSVKTQRRDDGLQYLKITQFNDDTKKLIDKLASELASSPPKGVIVDLRNNPGGLLDAAVDVSSYFIETGRSVVYQEDKNGRQDRFDSHSVPQTILRQLPLIVLMNSGSASASEILAGALNDHGRAKLVGEKSFGKGSVQDFHEFKNGSSIRVTVAKWLTPNKQAINGEGITPEFEIGLSDEDESAGRDPQLDKAVELLKS